jgi:hypothetical protein
MPGDSTLLVDLGNARLTVIAADGTVGDGLPMVKTSEEGEVIVMLPRHVDDRGRVYFRAQAIGPSALQDSAAILRFDRATQRFDTVSRVKMVEWERRDEGDLTRIGPRPLSPQDDWAVGNDGRVAIARVGEFKVEWVEPDGGSLAGPPQAYESVPVGRAEKEAWIEARASSGLAMSVRGGGPGGPQFTARRGTGRNADPPPIDSYNWPEALPPFRAGSLAVTTEGDLWLERYVPAGSEPKMDVFNSAGERTGSVLLPIGFGDGTAYLTRADDVGLVWLEQYRLSGGG